MRVGGVVVVAGALLAAAACSGGDDSADTTGATTEPTTSTTDVAVTTSEPAPTTASPPTTPPPETTSPTTLTTPTTPPPTTATTSGTSDNSSTSAPLDDFAAQAMLVLDRTEQSWGVVLTAFGDPFDDAKVAALEGYFTGNQLEGFNNLIDDFRTGNFELQPRADMTDTYDADPRSLALSLEADFATVQVCHISTALTVEVGGNPDGSDRVVADEIEQSIVELDVVRLDGLWKISSARAPETEIAECP